MTWNYKTARAEIQAAGPWSLESITKRIESLKVDKYKAEMRLQAAEQMQAHLKNGGHLDCEECGGYGYRDDGFLGDSHKCECNQ